MCDSRKHGRAVVDALAARKAAAEAQVSAALDLIQQAQVLLGRASEALASVEGMGGEWRRLGALFDQVKRRWYEILGRSDSLSLKGRLLLDHVPTKHELCGAAREGRS